MPTFLAKKTSLLDEYYSGGRSFLTKLQEDPQETNVERLVKRWRYHGQPISFAGYEYQIEPLNLNHPREIFRKASQVGGSTIAEMKVFLMLDAYGYEGYAYQDPIDGRRRYRYFTVLYTMESLDKVQEFASTRFNNFVNDNPFLKLALKQARSDSKRLKQFRSALLKMGSRTNIGSVRSTAVDTLVLDELSAQVASSTPDLTKNEAEIFSRLQGSQFLATPWTKGMVIGLSTPTYVGDEIQTWYERGDQRVWIVQCHHCERESQATDEAIHHYYDETGYGWQLITYGPDSIQSFYEKGYPAPVGEDGLDLLPVYQCKFCHEPLDWGTIGGWSPARPNAYRRCRWLPLRPEHADTRTGRGVVSYQLPFATAHRTAAQLMQERDNPKATIVFLYNNLLGFNFTDSSLSIEDNDLKHDPQAIWQTHAHPHEYYVMGVDLHGRRGTYVVILRFISGSKNAANPIGTWALCALEKIPTDKTFDDTRDGITTIGGLRRLIDQYHVALFVSDSEPHSTDVTKLVQAFPMKGYKNKSLSALRENFSVTHWDESVHPRRWEGSIKEAKVWAIDQVFDRIRAGYLIFPEIKEEAPHPHWREFLISVTSLHKQIQSNINASIKVTTEQYIPKNSTVADFDHFLSALKFADQAAEIFMENRGPTHVSIPPIIQTFTSRNE